MRSFAFAGRDTLTMLGRTLRHILRNPPAILGALGTPVFILLMMVYVFGGAMRVDDAGHAGTSYINYIVPGMLLLTVIQGTGMVAIRLNTDMRQGIIARFRTMSISRAAVLNGHMGGGVIGILISICVVIGLALLIGFQPTANLVEWIAAFGVLTLFAVAVTWLAAALGLVIKSPDGVSSSLFPLYLLPYFSSAFVPTETMPAAMAWFARHQPFTPIIETIRGLLLGTPVGNSAIVAIAWCVGLTLVGFFWALAAYNREPGR
jgi:ABC-2 type transport system permease protein